MTIERLLLVLVSLLLLISIIYSFDSSSNVVNGTHSTALETPISEPNARSIGIDESIFSEIEVTFNSDPLKNDAFLYNNKTYVSLRELSELFGAQVLWDEETNAVNIVTSHKNVVSDSLILHLSDYLVFQKFFNSLPNLEEFVRYFDTSYWLTGSGKFSYAVQWFETCVDSLDAHYSSYQEAYDEAYDNLSANGRQGLETIDIPFNVIYRVIASTLNDLSALISSTQSGISNTTEELINEYANSLLILDNLLKQWNSIKSEFTKGYEHLLKDSSNQITIKKWLSENSMQNLLLFLYFNTFEKDPEYTFPNYKDVHIEIPKIVITENDNKSSYNGSYSYIVYWVENGTVYDKSRYCPTLDRSPNIISGTISQSNKTRLCKVCG